jgi:hypothetical protein
LSSANVAFADAKNMSPADPERFDNGCRYSRSAADMGTAWVSPVFAKEGLTPESV